MASTKSPAVVPVAENDAMKNIVLVSKNCTKEIFTVKSDTEYFGVIQTETEFLLINEAFGSPLPAANHARSVARQLRKENKLGSTAHILKKVKAPVIRSKVLKKKELFTEAEVAKKTHLRFREVWVILNPEGCFVMEAIKNKTLVRYSAKKEQAMVFSSYEDALYTANTLDMVVRKGHQLRRYFEKHG